MQLTLLYIAPIAHKNNVDGDFTEDVSAFLLLDFHSTLDKSFLGFLTILISNDLCRRLVGEIICCCFCRYYYLSLQ